MPVFHSLVGCLLSLILLAPLLVREWGLTPVLVSIVFYSIVIVPAVTGYFSFTKLLVRVARSVVAVVFLYLPNTASANGNSRLRSVVHKDLLPFWSRIIFGYLGFMVDVWVQVCKDLRVYGGQRLE